MRRIMTAHQPNFLPYLGFFDKMRNSDIFVIRDEVQFIEREWHHRNKIRIQGKHNDGGPNWTWLTVPVYKEQTHIKNIRIKTNEERNKVYWYVRMLNQIKSNYEKTPYFKKYSPEFEKILSSQHDKLIDLNMELIRFLARSFGIETEIVFASELPFEHTGDSSQDLVEICKATKVNIYLSGSGGRNYLDIKPLEEEGIEVVFQNFTHPVYKQDYNGFLPNMASIDALFNIGGFPRD